MKKTNKSYDVDIDFEEVLESGGMLDQLLYYNDLQQRKLFLNTKVSPVSCAEIIKHIIQFNADDEDIPAEDREAIRLYIMSDGGDVDAGYALIDVIENSETPVYTISVGYVYSMAFMISLAGHKRFATKNTRFLAHDGFSVIGESMSKIHDRMEFQKQLDERDKQYVLKNSNLTEEEYDAKLRVDWYMLADEAKQHNFVDCIIGEDCNFADIV